MRGAARKGGPYRDRYSCYCSTGRPATYWIMEGLAGQQPVSEQMVETAIEVPLVHSLGCVGAVRSRAAVVFLRVVAGAVASVDGCVLVTAP